MTETKESFFFFSEKKYFLNNICFKIIHKLVYFCHVFQIIVDDYSLKFLKIFKIIIDNYSFNLKVKSIIGDYGFNHLKISQTTIFKL